MLEVSSGSTTDRTNRSALQYNRFFLIIFKIGTLYSPLKIFLPISGVLSLLGMGYYLYTYLLLRSFTNMSALLFTSAIIVFLIGLVSEQVTTLVYKDSE